MQLFLLHYNWLAKEAMRADKLQYNIVPKFHYGFHLIEASKFLNPKRVRCYSGEDFVGRISRLAHTCLPGLPSFRLSHSIMAKYRIAMHIRLSR